MHAGREKLGGEEVMVGVIDGMKQKLQCSNKLSSVLLYYVAYDVRPRSDWLEVSMCHDDAKSGWSYDLNFWTRLPIVTIPCLLHCTLDITYVQRRAYTRHSCDPINTVC